MTVAQLLAVCLAVGTSRHRYRESLALHSNSIAVEDLGLHSIFDGFRGNNLALRRQLWRKAREMYWHSPRPKADCIQWFALESDSLTL